jgi:hypothetical protein
MLGPEPPSVFGEKDPVYEGDDQGCPLSATDVATKKKFDRKLAAEKMTFCPRCKERWFDIKMRRDGHCRRCHVKDSPKNWKGDEPFFYSVANHINFSDVPAFLPELSLVEEMFIARVHVSVNVFTHRGAQYKYLGHVVHFLHNVGQVYDQLSLLPADLAVIILRLHGINGNSQVER